MSFLPCWLLFWHSIPICSFKCFLLLVSVVFWGGGGEKTMDHCGCTAVACSYIQTIATQYMDATFVLLAHE